MKIRWTAAVCLILLFLLSLGGMTSVASPPEGAGPPEMQVTERDDGRTVGIKGEVLVLNLESNPATGYSWQVERLDPRVLRPVGAPEWLPGAPGKLGAPGTQVLRFAAVGRGRATLELVYARPWETSAVPAKSFSLEVRVAESSRDVGYPEIPAEEPLAVAAGGVSLTALPAAYNWCDLEGCTPVRDQGACGSCWAFGTVGPLESAILLQSKDTRDLSEQYLVSCNVEGWGCNGGWWAHDYHEWLIPPSQSDFGAVSESDFPYTASDEPCTKAYTHHEKITDWVFIGNENSVPSTDAIKQAILDHGPVSAAVCVNTDFQRYTGGVFNPRKPCNSINHAIVLVGWDDARGAWRLRNSWGPNWGEDGYMWIAYGKSYVGYSANYVVYHGSEPPPPPPPPEGSIHVSAIDMGYTQAGKNYFVYTTVTIVDEAGSPISGATVDLSTTLSNGTVATGSGQTGADGTVTFSVKSKLTGTYVSEVTNVTHASYTYDPAANAIARVSLLVP